MYGLPFWTQQILDPEKVHRLLLEAQDQFESHQFRPAQIGRQNSLQQNEEIRRDQIQWIEDWSKDPLRELADFYQMSQKKFREELFLPVKRFEAHFALYTAGDFYKKHVDQHQNQPFRLISSVLYLNDVPQGGELVIYTEDGETAIRPRAGLQVFFDSRLPHEVKPTKSDRWSLTGWFRSDIGSR